MISNINISLPKEISFGFIQRYSIGNYAFNPITYDFRKISSEERAELTKNHGGLGGRCWGIWYLFIRTGDEYYLKIGNSLFDLKRDNLRLVWFRKNQIWARFELWGAIADGVNEQLLHERSYLIHPCTNAFDTPGRLARWLTNTAVWKDTRQSKQLDEPTGAI
jgi:hypothetical protein